MEQLGNKRATGKMRASGRFGPADGPFIMMAAASSPHKTHASAENSRPAHPVAAYDKEEVDQISGFPRSTTEPEKQGKDQQ